MVKRSIQLSKPGVAIGIENDHLGIRVAKLSTNGRGDFDVERLEEVKGDFTEDLGLLEGLRQVKTLLNLNSRESVVTCLSGKQVFASQFGFRILPPEEMEQALRLELRKTVHFEVATSTLDYQVLSDGEQSAGEAQIVVALASNQTLNRQTSLLGKAGLRPTAVDVLPLVVSNALRAFKGTDMGSAPLVALHVGPQLSTVVVDGEESQFFNRNLYFAAEEIFTETANPKDREKRLKDLAQEVARSLAYYEKSAFASGFREIHLLGDYLDQPGLADCLRDIAGLRSVRMDLPSRLGYTGDYTAGKFDLAVTLAMRGDA